MTQLLINANLSFKKFSYLILRSESFFPQVYSILYWRELSVVGFFFHLLSLFFPVVITCYFFRLYHFVIFFDMRLSLTFLSFQWMLFLCTVNLMYIYLFTIWDRTYIKLDYFWIACFLSNKKYVKGGRLSIHLHSEFLCLHRKRNNPWYRGVLFLKLCHMSVNRVPEINNIETRKYIAENEGLCSFHSNATNGLNISSLSFKVIQHHVVCDVSKKKEVCFRFYFPNATEPCVQGLGHSLSVLFVN